MGEMKVIACNHLGNKYIPKNSRAYVFWPNGGSYHQYLFIYVRTRGGRYVKKWENIRSLINFRPVSAFNKRIIDLDGRVVDYPLEKAKEVSRVLNEALVYWNQKHLERRMKDDSKN